MDKLYIVNYLFFVMYMMPQNNILPTFLIFFPEDTYERTLMVDGESATIILLDMWDNKVLLFMYANHMLKEELHINVLIEKIGIFS